MSHYSVILVTALCGTELPFEAPPRRSAPLPLLGTREPTEARAVCGEREEAEVRSAVGTVFVHCGALAQRGDGLALARRERARRERRRRACKHGGGGGKRTEALSARGMYVKKLQQRRLSPLAASLYIRMVAIGHVTHLAGAAPRCAMAREVGARGGGY